MRIVAQLTRVSRIMLTRKTASIADARSVVPQMVDPELPRIAQEIPEYRSAFEHAARFTSSVGFPLAEVDWLNDQTFVEDGTVIQSALQAAGVTGMQGAIGQCLKWSHFLTPAISREARCSAWVTLGQLWKDDEAIFTPSWDDLRRWGRLGIQPVDFEGRRGFNLHAWITLQTGEIVDPTYFSTLAAVAPGFEEAAGKITWGRDPYAIASHRYYPMALGSAFVEGMAARSAVRLLASNAADLQRRDAVFVRLPR